MIKYLANIILELQSPLCIASGLENSYSDTQVRRDWNNLPVIPGTSLKGVIKSLASEDALKLLGIQTEPNSEENTGEGSSLIVNDALLQDSNGKVYTQLNNAVFQDELLKHYKILPNREHVCINHLGVTDGKGKFTNAIVHKGSRFQLQLKLEVNKAKDVIWEEILTLFYRQDFLLGSQATNGLGQIKPISIVHRKFDFSNMDDLQDFCAFTPYSAIVKGNKFTPKTTESTFELYKQFKFTTDAIHIGVGYGDDEVNASNLQEKCMLWNFNGNFTKAATNYVIPGASIKGVLRHRTFYYLCPAYDWKSKICLQDYKDLQKEAEAALESLFGSKAESKNENGHIGNVIVEDVTIDEKFIRNAETTFQHNSIDRFTGGTIDKMLFSEKVYAIKQPTQLKIWLSHKEGIDKKVLEAFDKAIDDLKNGRLALGGNTTNGNGFLKVAN
ncbi:CRISPR/Cas system CSM-associated protein Csm3 (group 7 of RAMP superfamily) [Kordia periserrulae]|uniref:CRISPR/Cas system CSM-associated protein Csm3 (Group 7 of RAMP superfamily) n=1 Tax=Kordia periserrulae TaxID=701523 RepID=A0A2T6BUU5_9FLAO|nr:RAMP superfamily CRISPR-associated protein [Kordia periserrulae]PTX59816.1 CRISPR/Cas system CSM-associated protein Csm3 (group 7 of RAMP superfamily) [Kordia periserrulae]